MGDGFDVYVFELDGQRVFNHYLDNPDLFDELREYYVRDAYRFEVPADEFEAVVEALRAYGYEPTVVDDPEPFCICIGQYEPHADILRDSVANWTRQGHRFFLMRSRVAVEQAIRQGATPVADTEFEAGI